MKILIYVSNQSNSQPAVLFGGVIARSTGAAVTLITVTRNQNPDLARRALEEASGWVPDLDVSTAVRVGPVVSGILEEIRDGTYDMVILKSRQAISLRHLLTSQISNGVLLRSPISVLVVKSERPELKRILICTGGLEIAGPVVEMGASLACSFQAKVTLLHVMSAVPSMYAGLEKIEEHLSELLQTDTQTAQHLRRAAGLMCDKDIEAQMELRYGVVPEEIFAEAQAGSYDLVVIGNSRASSSITSWLMGDITRKIVHQVHCPVLVVRQENTLP